MKNNRILTIGMLAISISSTIYADEGNVSTMQTIEESPLYRVVGGNVVSPTNNQWQSIVFLDAQFTKCAGTLISPKWVLTAGHCVNTIGAPQITIGVRVGSYNRNELTYYHQNVKNIILHEGFFMADNIVNDIALLELLEPIENIQSTLYNSDTTSIPAGTTVDTAGWGMTSSSNTLSDDLREISLPTVDRISCNSIDAHNGYITENMICAGTINDTNYTGSCHGDSGGPLMLDNKIIGIVSWGDNNCTDPKKPTVFTNVQKYAGWIQEHVGSDNNSTVFETTHPYANNEHQNGTLSIAGASCLAVSITGETEQGYDYITVGDQRFDGALNEHFQVNAGSVDYLFTSDGSVTKQGVVVEVSECNGGGNHDSTKSR